jgi:hypothetical protein
MISALFSIKRNMARCRFGAPPLGGCYKLLSKVRSNATGRTVRLKTPTPIFTNLKQAQRSDVVQYPGKQQSVSEPDQLFRGP